MKYVLENNSLILTVSSKGAEIVSVIDKKSGKERIWQANPDVWAGQAPLLFPWCGRLLNSEITHNGKTWPTSRHGFARISVFEFKEENNKLIFELEGKKEDKEDYPYDFLLKVIYSLDNNKVIQKVEVYNTGKAVLPFNVGFHPAFALDANGEKYEVVFEKTESPTLILTPDGLVSGEKDVLFENSNKLVLADDVFANDSYCMEGLKSEYLEIKRGNESVRVGIKGFEYCLLWGPAKGGALPFTCIEPWHGIPDPAKPYGDFINKPGITKLEAGNKYETVLEMEFNS